MSVKALGLIETKGLAAGIEAADAAVKSANVTLIGYEVKQMSGMVTVKVEGDVGAVQAAIQAACSAADRLAGYVSAHVIPRPAEGIEKLIRNADTTGFAPQKRGKPKPSVPKQPEEEAEAKNTLAATEPVKEAPASEKTQPPEETEPKVKTESEAEIKPKAAVTPDKVKLEEPKPIKEETKPVKEEPKPVKEEAKPVKEEPKPVKEEPKPVKEEPKPVKEDNEVNLPAKETPEKKPSERNVKQEGGSAENSEDGAASRSPKKKK